MPTPTSSRGTLTHEAIEPLKALLRSHGITAVDGITEDEALNLLESLTPDHGARCAGCGLLPVQGHRETCDGGAA